MTSPSSQLRQGPIDIIRHRWLYVAISLIFLVPGLVFMVLNAIESPIHSPIKLGIDFTGGTILEYGFNKTVSQSDLPTIRKSFDAMDFRGSVIQLQEPRTNIQSDDSETKEAAAPQQELLNAPAPAEKAAPNAKASDTKTAQSAAVESKPNSANTMAAVKTPTPGEGDRHLKSIMSIRTRTLGNGEQGKIEAYLTQTFGKPVLLQKSSIGPSMASEILVNGLFALLLAYVLIVGYLTFRFQFDYAICAIIAMLHDTIFVIGMYAIFGYFFQTEVDSLFITGILTVIGFSVHDTIVVFDRLRENSRVLYSKKLPFSTIANMSVNQTLARSINTSLTALLTLVALYIFGGETTRDFVMVMILGIIVGMFSSIFIAALLLAWWRERNGAPASAKAATA